MQTDVGVVLTDPHSLASSGLMPPDARDDNGEPLRQNYAQKFVWRCWLKTREQADLELLPTEGGKKWLFVLGDLLENRHHDTTQIATVNMATMRRIAGDVLLPWVEWSDHSFFTKGTEAHSGPAGADEESIVDGLSYRAPGKIVRHTRTGRATAYNWRVWIQDTLHDLAHHPISSTGRLYLAHGPAGITSVSVWMDHQASNDRPPTVAWRGHNHPRQHIGDTGYTYETRTVICPCWKLADGHGARLSPGQLNIIGAVFFRVMGSRVDLWPVTYLPAREAAWREPTGQTTKRSASRTS